MHLLIHMRVSSRLRSSSVISSMRARASLEYGFVFVSRSHCLNSSIRDSITFRDSTNGALFFTSLLVTQLLICVRVSVSVRQCARV
jgi:hypothetical protein